MQRSWQGLKKNLCQKWQCPPSSASVYVCARVCVHLEPDKREGWGEEKDSQKGWFGPGAIRVTARQVGQRYCLQKQEPVPIPGAWGARE